jgi:hypothetical protein
MTLLAMLLTGFIGFGQAPFWEVMNTSNSGIAHDCIKCLAVDKSGNLWIGTYLNGLAMYDGHKWTLFNTDNSGLMHNHINSIFVDENDIKWVATDGGGLARFDGTNWMTYSTANSGLPSNTVMTIVRDRKGILWIGTYFAGLARFDGTNWKTFDEKNSDLPINKIITLSVDHNNVKWIGTHGGGLVSYNDQNFKSYNESNSKIGGNFVYSIDVDSANVKWIGTGGGGVCSYNDIFWSVYNSSNSRLPDDNVRPIEINRKGIKFIGTYFGGLTAFDGTNWYNYNSKNSSVPDDEINCILSFNDRIYLGTERSGLISFPDTLKSIREKEEELAKEMEARFVTNTRSIIFDKSKQVDTVLPMQGDYKPRGWMQKNNIVLIMDARGIENEPRKLRQFLRAYRILLNKRENIDDTYTISLMTCLRKVDTNMQDVRINDRQKKFIHLSHATPPQKVAPLQKGLMKAYDLIGSDIRPGANNQVILATASTDLDESIKAIIDKNYTDRNIKFSLLSFGNPAWREEYNLKNMVPRGGGEYYSVKPVKFTDNWSVTAHFGSSIFKGDMDVKDLFTIPGEFGFALNKKVVSNFLLNGGLKGQFNWGQLNGQKKDFTFENKYFESCLNFQIILNSWINRNFRFEKVRPYAFGGIGTIRYRTILRDSYQRVINYYGYSFDDETAQISSNTPDKAKPLTELIFPVGAGATYEINEDMGLEMEISSRFINSDKLDAKIAKKNDKYLFFSFGLTYKFKEQEFLSNILNR